MNKINYDKLMSEQISGLKNKPKLLLQSCCAPCSTAVIERLVDFFDVTIFYYNPNIYPKEEYFKRSGEQVKLAKQLKNVKLIVCDYDEQQFLEKVKGLESEKEGGARCPVCFCLRLQQTAEFAKQNGYDFFATTLTVSPHKNEQIINQIGNQIAEKYGVKFLNSDFKKHEGYKRSIILSKEFDLYRQNYCGCRFSIPKGEWYGTFCLRNI